MAKIVFVPPFGEDLQLSCVDGCFEVSSDINVLLNLNKKAQDVHTAENILARVRELPLNDESVDLSSESGAPSRFFDSLSDRLAVAKAELKRLDAEQDKYKDSVHKREAFEHLQALKKKLGLEDL
jgi:hypothetical protein